MTDNSPVTKNRKIRTPARPAETVLARRSPTPTLGLALGGGGARGLAHLLILELLDEMRLKPAIIAGTSIGAMFGAAYASGMTAAEIRAHIEDVLSRRLELLRQMFTTNPGEPLQQIFSVFQLRSALLRPDIVLERLMPERLAENFDDLQIPLKVIASDYFTQDQYLFDEGDLKTAVAASIALPVLFSPVQFEDRALLDGGLVNPLPFDTITGEADIIIAIDVSGAGRQVDATKPPKARETIIGSLQILQNTLVREKLRSRRPDILIEADVGHFHALNFLKFREILAAAEPAKAELRQRLERILSAETLDTLEQTPSKPKKQTTKHSRSQKHLASRVLTQRKPK